MIHGGEIYDKNIELDFSVNLNPYPCPDEVLKCIQQAAFYVDRYPDMMQMSFRKKVAAAENRLAGGSFVTAENVIGGNGASELIMGIIRLVNPKKVLLFVPCFYGYFHGIKSCGNTEIVMYPLSSEKNFEPANDSLNYIDETIDMVILGNPNNPTGKQLNKEFLDQLVKKCDERGTTLLMDECFLHLSDNPVSAVRYLDERKKLFIVNAYTKLFSIPGVRVGYALASKENCKALRAFLPEWNMSVFAQHAGETCAKIIMSTDYVEKSRAQIRTLRQRMADDLENLGIKVFSSQANFLLVWSNKGLYDFFLKQGILIRDCSNYVGLKEGYYRIAIKDAGSYERMKKCLLSLTQV